MVKLSVKYLKFIIFILLLILVGYLLRDGLADLLHPKSPREIYLRSERRIRGKQDQYLLRWESLNDYSLRKARPTTAGFVQLWHFNFTDQPETSSLSYRFDLPAGRKLTATAFPADTEISGQLFAELYLTGEDQDGVFFLRVTNWKEEDYHLTFTPERSGSYVLLIQSDLTYTGNVSISLTEGPSLSFPVAGVSDRAAQSFWGVERDGGRRKHEGVDIFADRGTPLLSSAPARVSRVKEGGLGGKVVWLWCPEHQLSLYYAHLDQQLVTKGEWLNAGDTIGLVGNTGNARTTPPHLHFGVYPNGGKAIDPWPYINRQEEKPAPPSAETASLGQLIRVPARGTYYLRGNPLTDQSTILRKLDPGEEVYVAGVQEQFTIVRTAGDETGYVIWD